MKLIVLVLSIFVLLEGVHAQTLVWQDTRPHITRMALLIDASNFTDTYVEAICRRTLNRQKASEFLLVRIGVDRAEPLPKPDHFTYDYWRRLYGVASRSATPVAELTAIDGAAVLRIRGSDGQVRTKVLVDRNPLSFDFDARRLEILHFAFSPKVPYRAERVDVYARTEGRLSITAGQRLWELLRTKLPGVALYVYVRNDEWFVYEPSFPFFYAFGNGGGPPTEYEVRSTPTVRCSGFTGIPKCTLQ